MNDLQKLIDKVIDKAIVGCDTYKHNGSTWLLFTDDKKWVIELTKEGTLWYNYYFFQKLFKVIALDVVENQHYITKWVEDTVINGVKSIKGEYYKEIQKVEYTIQNGVRCTQATPFETRKGVEDTIQNGVKHTSWHEPLLLGTKVEDTIQNGVKNTRKGNPYFQESVEDTIQNGVKQTELSKRDFFPKDIIQDGLKINGTYVGGKRQNENVENIIKNGVKELKVLFKKA